VARLAIHPWYTECIMEYNDSGREYFEALDKRKEQVVADLRQLREVGTSKDSKLPRIINSMWNYRFDDLSYDYDKPVNVLSAARFDDGIFYILRLPHGDKIMQHELKLYTYDGPSRIVSFDVHQERGKLVRSGWSKDLIKKHSIANEPVPTIITSALHLAEQEAAAEEPWPNAISSAELRKYRRGRGVHNVTKFAINEALGEPYL
jgi:hypothetical protein